MVVLFVVLTAMAWVYTQLFTGRAAMLHMGAFTATIMAANVAMIIIPNQKIVVADLKAGRVPDAKYGKIAKQRSLHNNYLTLPVIFFMLSSHYPLAFATQWNWVIAALIFLDGRADPALFQHPPRPQGQPALDLGRWRSSSSSLIAWLSSRPEAAGAAKRRCRRGGQAFHRQRRISRRVRDTVLGRCSMCHTAEPVCDGRDRRAQERHPRQRRRHRQPRRADRHAGRLFARHAAGQCHRHEPTRSGR